MLNISPLFYTTDNDCPCLLCEIDLTSEERNFINAAKTSIRTCLRSGIPKLLKDNNFEGAAPIPKFYTQGSWAYKTINAPAHVKIQQADIDDGCYLPMSFATLTKRPSYASKLFFAAAEKALEPLCKENRWELNRDKDTCIRVYISKTAHIDIPLYAIPDDEYQTMSQHILEAHGYASFSAALEKHYNDSWTALPADRVMLAHRTEDWILSDPRPVKKWFEDEVAAKGEQLRRVVRYLKAVRDWKWPTKGPSSILLMAAAAPVFEENQKRDDLALLTVASSLPEALRQGVSNPTNKDESLTDRLGEPGVSEAIAIFTDFAEVLRGAIESGSADQVCHWMREEFGPRFPHEPERVKLESIRERIMAAPAIEGPEVLPERTHSA